MTDEERAEYAELDREMTALEAASRGWDRWSLFRDSNDNVRPPTPQERAGMDELLGAIR